MTTLEQIQSDLAENKRLMRVHQGDEETLKRLSQEKEALKKRLSKYCSCGQPKKRDKLRCYSCYLRNRFYSHVLAPATALLFLFGCSSPPAPVAKGPVSPPMPQAMQGFSASQPAKVIPHGCTNCPAPVQIVSNGVFYLVWKASPTPNVSYQVAETTNLFRPFFIAGVTTNLWWKVYATNAMGLFKVRAINSQGLVSIWATT